MVEVHRQRYLFVNMEKNLWKHFSIRFHLTTFTAQYSKEAIDFLDINIRLLGVRGDLTTDLFVRPTNTHQCSDRSSSHPYHCNKGAPYSQALKRNRNIATN